MGYGVDFFNPRVQWHLQYETRACVETWAVV